MKIELKKEEFIETLQSAMQEFYQAKAEGDKEKIKYSQGYTKGLIFMFRKLEIIDQEELVLLAKDAELEIPPIFRV